MDFINIKFVKHYQGYVPGDVTGRPPSQADALVSRGVAQIINQEKKEVELPAVDKQVKNPRIKKGR